MSLKDMKIASRIAWLQGLIVLLLLLVGAMAIFGLGRASDSLKTVREDRMIPLDQLAGIESLMLGNQLLLARGIADPAAANVASVSSELSANIDKVSKLWDAYMATYLTPEERRVAEQFAAKRKDFVAHGLQPVLAALQANDVAGAAKLYETVSAKWRAVSPDLDSLQRIQLEEAEHEFNNGRSAYEWIRLLTIALFAAAVVVAIWGGRVVVRSITEPILRARELAKGLGEGRFDLDVGRITKDETGELLSGLASTQQVLKVAAESAASNLRLRVALESVTSNVMIADEGNNVIFMNQSVSGMLSNAESDIRKDLPNFQASGVIGSNIDIFHKNPAHQRDMLSRLRESYRTRIVVGGRTFGLIATPIFDASRQRTGTVVEWSDLTAQVVAEQEAASNLRIRNALEKCSTNVMIADAQYHIMYMNETMVAMLQRNESELRKVLPQFDSRTLMGRNIDIFHKNPAHQRGVLDNLKSTYRTQIKVGALTFSLTANPIIDAKGERVGTVVEWSDRTLEVNVENEVAEIVAAAASGDFSQRLRVEGKTGFFANLSSGINTVMETSERGLDDISALLESFARGDLTQRMNQDYSGLFAKVKDNANATAEGLTRVLSEVRAAADALTSAADQVSATAHSLS